VRPGEGAVPLPRKLLNFSSKNAAFYALLSIDLNMILKFTG